MNSEVVHRCYGFRALLEAALDPSLHDIAESIIVTILQLVGNPRRGENTSDIFDQRVLVSFSFVLFV